MNNITQNLFSDYLFSINISHLKSILKLQRLKTNRVVISFYLYCIYLHYKEQKTFKYIHKHYFFKKYKVKYSAFMHSIKLYSVLIKYQHKYICLKRKFFPTVVNIVDSTLIEEKQSKFIISNDYKNSRVTVRNKEKICGSKGLCFLNSDLKIYHAQLLNINISDQNILKDSAIYYNLLGKVLLADRGFNNKNVQARVKTFDCQLISPNHYKVVEKTGKYFDKDWYINIYKRRWKIETVFQKMKNNYSDFKLNLKGKYTSRLKEAKFFLCIIDYNLSF